MISSKHAAPANAPQLSVDEPWIYIPLSVAAALSLVLNLTGNNAAVFIALNQLGIYTGDDLWAHLTVLGDTLIALSLLFACAGRYPKLIWAGMLAAILSALWIHGLKNLFDMPRPPAVLSPELLHIIGPALKKYSFPSGHTTTIFVLAAVLCLHLRLNSLRILVIIIALLVGISRAVVGVHWPLDILAGVFGGWLSGIAGIILARRFPAGLADRPQLVMNVILALCAVAVIVRPDPIYPQTYIFQIILAGLCLVVGNSGLWKQYHARKSKSAQTAASG